MLSFYSLALLLALSVTAPWWLFRMVTSGKYREGLSERLGIVPVRVRHADAKPVIWVHAVSVGEVIAASGLIAELRTALPAWRVMISTTTRTGQKIARERFGEDSVFYFPLDFAFAVRAWLKALQPGLVVLLETEFWPRMLHECRTAGVPVAVVNARISDRSWPRYMRLRFLWRRLLNGFRTVLAQSELDAERLQAIGASNVRVGGNLKYDIRAAKSVAIIEVLQQNVAEGTHVIVAGSTLAGEEEIVLDAIPPDAVLILAPRHPERFDAVSTLLRSRSRNFVRRSEWAQQPARLEPGTVVLLDSIGELASVYALASVAIIGGGFLNAGGHNPLEPAQFGVPVVMGPHYENFRAIVEKLRESDGVMISDAASLAATVRGLLSNPQEAANLGANALAVFKAEAGATARAVSALLEIVGESQ
ncbi:3-deoxy-D-manno-octulosonic acid transferase [Silvibacterium acidisoli]|uniref:3-deoxy-D-manno-octulosonic acid transferase n=1 Tax=Acidobacteriaceae bacterium ZG23-2 TaxID=2883246 RepID=UPI00406BF1FE